MALSDQLTKLAARAKEAEDRTAAAQGKAKAELEDEVKTARKAAQTQADQLGKAAETRDAKLSGWWVRLQRSWTEHIAEIDARLARMNADELAAGAKT